MSKWPDSKDPSATFFTGSAYKRYNSEERDSHNKPARKNPEVPLFEAMLSHEKSRKESPRDKQFTEILRTL